MDKRPEDMGIDLPVYGVHSIAPGEVKIIDTGITFDFPISNWVRRKLTKLIFGMEVTGVGGLVRPRSRDDIVVLAGVVDPGYRGTIKVKAYNPTGEKLFFNQTIAQLVPTLCLHDPLTHGEPDWDTARGKSGGINSGPC